MHQFLSSQLNLRTRGSAFTVVACCVILGMSSYGKIALALDDPPKLTKEPQLATHEPKLTKEQAAAVAAYDKAQLESLMDEIEGTFRKTTPQITCGGLTGRPIDGSAKPEAE